MSIDSPELVPLTLVDLTEQDLVDIAVADATVKLPGWVPREGHTEVVVLEAQALITAELVYALNLLPDAVLEAVIGLYGLARDAGAPPSASFTLATSSTTPVLVPSGTRLRVSYNTVDVLDFLTTTDLSIAANGSATVVATAVENTSVLNGTPTGVSTELVDAISTVDTVTLASAVTGGRGVETSVQYRSRGANLFRRLTSTLVLPAHFTAASLEVAGVARAQTLDNFNPTLGTGSPGSHPGNVTVAAAVAGGGALSTPVKDALVSDLTSKAHSGLAIHVIAPTITAVPITVSVTLVPGFASATVIAAVNAALAAYLNPDAWAWSGTVYRNELISLIDRVPGVGRVVTLTAPAADVALAGVAPLAQAGVLTTAVV